MNLKKPADVANSASRTIVIGAAEPRVLARQPLPRAVIDAALTIEGDLQTDREVELNGRIAGDVGCSRLIVGQNAAIAGNIKADEVVVRGKVTGTIRASRVILQDTANVEAAIFHDSIIIEEGARFVGTSNTGPAGKSSIITSLN